MEEYKAYNHSPEEVAEQLDTNVDSGLSQSEAKARFEKYGPNELQVDEHRSLLQKFIDQFKDFMIVVLLIAAAISAFVGYMEGEGVADAIIILLVVFLNAILGVFQENKAEEAIDALKDMSSPEARVIRDGSTMHIKSTELVPGDVVIVEAGDVVPADVRFIKAHSLQIEEAALTGESVPTEKDVATIQDEEVGIGDRTNMGFSSTNVTYGNGTGIVVATGTNTEVGHIATMLSNTEQQLTPLQRDQEALGKQLTVLIIIIAILTFIVGTAFQGLDILQMLLTSISLAVAAIPEGLPAITTIILSLGTQTMANRNALIRTLPAVETLGSTQVICSDKTGTLTLNEMTIEKVYYNGQLHEATDDLDTESNFIRSFTFANDSHIDASGEVKGDPTETAMVKYAIDHDMDLGKQLETMPRIEEVPFESDRKLMSTIHELEDGRYYVAVKGAPDQLIKRCTSLETDGENVEMSEEAADNILDANESLARQALRVLAGAYKIIDTLPETIDSESIEHDLIFTGLMGMIDPERPEARASINTARQAGVRTVMITGDHAITAQAIAERLTILDPNDANNADHVLTGAQLNKISDEELAENVKNYSVYARVSPEHKVRIIKAWQSHGFTVAMTGDGVNDAPSLKQADIGVGMGITGTEVSKGAADMVLADDNFQTIVVAVEEGRKVFANIQKAVQFLLSANLGEVLTLFLATLFGWTILEPIHILWINLVTDVFPAISLGFEDAESDVMTHAPRTSDDNFLSFGIAPSILYQGVLESALTLGIYYYTAYHLTVPSGVDQHNLAETMAFITLGLIQLFHAYNVKSTFKSLFSSNPFGNKYLNLAFLVSGAMLLGVILIPGINTYFDVTVPTFSQWLLCIGTAFSIVIIVEIIKWLFRVTGYADRFQRSTHQ